MSHIAELVVSHPDLALASTLRALPDVEVEVDSQPATVTDSPALFYSVETPSFARFESELDTDHTVDAWSVESDFGDRRIYRVTLSDAITILTPTLTEYGLRILDATSAEAGWRLRVHVPDREDLVAFQNHCLAEGVDCQIRKLYSTGDGDEFAVGGTLELTDRQREVAETATDMGYFTQEGASAEEVADALDIAPSTLSSHLRAVTKTLFEHHFGR